MIGVTQIAFGSFFRGRRGSSLVEVLVSCLILMTAALAGAAYLYQSRANLAFQRGKRIALEAANARMEEIRATSYETLRNLVASDYNLHYLAKVDGAWQVSNADPGETANINGQMLPMKTTLRYEDIPGGASSYDYLVVIVSASYRVGSDDRVTLRSIYAP